MNGSPELEHSSSLAHIETASENGALLLCSISLWETAALARQGRLRPSLPLRDWIEQSLETPGLRMVEIDAAIAAEAAALPGRFDGDGADRLIVAAARSRHALLATADDTLKRYAAAGHLRILEV
jgi:PIN domain nuclease of toxin-antitoxin system